MSTSQDDSLPSVSVTWLQCLGLSKRHAEAVVRSHNDALDALREDKARLDYLCDQCHLPDDHPTKGVFMCVGLDAIPRGGITMNLENDRGTIRAAIDAARK